MRTTTLILAWLTPAVIAGMLGWTGIWGTGSALFEYLIPVPVAGGVLHVPSYAVAAACIVGCGRLPPTAARLLAVAAFAVFAAALALHVDFERFNAWLFTDFEPYGSPVRFESNAVLLFVTTDAFFVGAYALAVAGLPAPAWWLVLPLASAAVFGIRIGEYRTAGPAFTIGGSLNGPARGDQTDLVYTSAGYDEALLRAWLDEHPYIDRPWNSPNSEHVAVIFTNSRQVVEYRQFDQLDGPATVATVCMYEEDRTIEAYPGYRDCFAVRETVAESLTRLAAEAPTGFGADVDGWYARLRLCEEFEPPPPEPATDIERVGICSGLERDLERTLERLGQRYGADSAQLAFVRDAAAAAGLAAAAP